MWTFNVLILLLLCQSAFNQMDSNTYGPYKLIWHNIETCKGPKQGSCGIFNIENTHNMSDIIFILDFPKDCPVTTSKITVSTKQNNTIKKLWSYAVAKPCQHFALGPILSDTLNVTNSCKVNKGRYVVHLNFQQRTEMFLGSKFFYGTYAFNTIAFNKVNNFFCVSTLLDIEKKSN